MKNKVNINGVEIEKIIENPQHLGGLVSKFNELLDALDEKKEECSTPLGKANRHIAMGDTIYSFDIKEEPKPQCVKENGYFVCYCGKCEPDNYPLPADFPKQPKSTLREATLKIVRTVADLQAEPVADKIISLFKDTLLKEIKETEMPEYQNEGAEHAHAGYVRALEDITNIIKNL